MAQLQHRPTRDLLPTCIRKSVAVEVDGTLVVVVVDVGRDLVRVRIRWFSEVDSLVARAGKLLEVRQA